jgi:hypothetical protein
MRDGTPLPTNRVLCWRAGDIDSGGSAARMGRWKIRGDNGAGSFSLYDLETDVHEDSNVAGAHPAEFNELLERFQAWNASNIEPLYGGSDLAVDSNLERNGITSGYRVRNRTATAGYLSASLRNAVPTASDFSLGFYLRPTETNHAAGAELWFALGDTAARGDFIRAGVDFENGLLKLVEGKSGGSAAAGLPALPRDWHAGTLTFDAATRALTFALGGTNVSVVLPGTYGNLDVYGCGATAMEGEVTQPFFPATPAERAQSSNILLTPAALTFDTRFTGGTVLGPTLERAILASGPYELDRDALLENLGGGLYRITTPTNPGADAEFIRVGLNRP